MARADIDPIDIPNLLPHIGLIDVIDERTFRYRLIGTHLNRVFGDDFTGDHLDAVKSGPYMEFLRSLYGDCARDGAPLFNRALFGYVKSEDLIVNRLLLPLRDTADGPVTMLLFSNTFDLYERRVQTWYGTNVALAGPFEQHEIGSITVLQQKTLTELNGHAAS